MATAYSACLRPCRGRVPITLSSVPKRPIVSPQPGRLSMVLSWSRAFWIGAALALAACGQNNTYQAPPPPKVTVAQAGRAEGHALFRGDRQHRRGQLGQSGGARAGLPDRDQVRRRHAGEEGPAPLHHRARALSAQAAAGAGGRGRRAGDARSRPKPTSSASRNWCSARPPRRRRSTPRRPSATTTRRRCCRRRPTPSRRRSISTTPRWWRRSTASSRRARSRSANWSAAAARRCSPPSCSSIRST